MGKQQNLTLIILAFFSIYVIWGATYLWNKVAVSELPPFMLAAIRFLSASTLIFLICSLLRIPFRISVKQLKNTAVAGFFFLTFANGVMVWALKFVDTGFAALIIAAQPLVVLLLMWAIRGKRIKSQSLLGIGLGILGIFLLVSQNTTEGQSFSLVGLLMIFSCMFSWGYGSVFVGQADLPQNFLVNTGYQMLCGGIMLVIISLFFGETWSFPWDWGFQVQISLLLLIVFGSIVAFTSFNYLLKFVSPEKVATNTYVNPIIALILGWYFLGETITIQSCVAAAVLLTGVYFINSTRKKANLPKFIRKH